MVKAKKPHTDVDKYLRHREHSLIKVTGEGLPRAVQQLRLLPRVETTSQFLHLRADRIAHFNGL